MSDIPDPREELDRKVNETLAEWISNVEAGAVTPESAQIALQTLWAMSAGLVPRSTMDLLTDALTALDEQPRVFAPTRLFHNPRKQIVALVMTRDGALLHIGGKGSKQLSSKNTAPDEEREIIEETVTRLVKAGFEEFTNG